MDLGWDEVDVYTVVALDYQFDEFHETCTTQYEHTYMPVLE